MGPNNKNGIELVTSVRSTIRSHLAPASRWTSGAFLEFTFQGQSALDNVEYIPLSDCRRSSSPRCNEKSWKLLVDVTHCVCRLRNAAVACVLARVIARCAHEILLHQTSCRFHKLTTTNNSLSIDKKISRFDHIPTHFWISASKYEI